MPNIAKDEDVEVLHLGVFKNGGTHKVDDDRIVTWQAHTGREWPKDGLYDVSTGFEPTEANSTLVHYPQDDAEAPVGNDKEGAE